MTAVSAAPSVGKRREHCDVQQSQCRCSIVKTMKSLCVLILHTKIAFKQRLTFLIYFNFTFNSILTIMEWKGFNKVPGQENQDWTINQYGQVQHPNRRSCNCFATQNVSQHTIINAALWCDRDAPAYISCFSRHNGTILWGAKIMSLSSL